MTLHSAEKFSSDDAWIRAGRRVLSVEIEALQHLESRLDAAFADACRRLLGFYRDLSGSFRGLDARIPREMDQKGREALETMAQANLRLAAVFRRQNQPEVAVPLLVEVVKVMTPANPEGRKAYQNLVEIGFAATPYSAGDATAPGK